MNVHILLTIPTADVFDDCTLCFETLRVGFPTANIHITTNGHVIGGGQIDIDILKRAGEKIKRFGFKSHHSSGINHFDWIKYVLTLPDDGTPTIILDGDTIFWSSCEGWKFEENLAGYYVPLHLTEFGQMAYISRLHTSLLWIESLDQLRSDIEEAGPVYLSSLHKTYQPWDPVSPHVSFVNRKPAFYDTCAELYHGVGGSSFTEEHLNCYDHINSSSFIPLMMQLLKKKDSFMRVHEVARTDPKQLRGLWREIDKYYQHQASLL